MCVEGKSYADARRSKRDATWHVLGSPKHGCPKGLGGQARVPYDRMGWSLVTSGWWPNDLGIARCSGPDGLAMAERAEIE